MISNLLDPPIVATVCRKLFALFYDDGDNQWGGGNNVSFSWNLERVAL